MTKETEKKKRLHQRILDIMRKKDNWSSCKFFISDFELRQKLKDELNGTIYGNIHYYSEKALDKIYDLMHETGYRRDFAEAVHDAKHLYNLPLLNKIKDNPSIGIVGGWQQPNLSMLDLDQRRRLFSHEKGFDTAQNRTEKVDKIKNIDLMTRKKVVA
jgi:hypothetical protein